MHISSAAGKSASVSYLDICDFVQTNVEEEVVLGSQGDQQYIVKSGPKSPFGKLNFESMVSGKLGYSLQAGR